MLRPRRPPEGYEPVTGRIASVARVAAVSTQPRRPPFAAAALATVQFLVTCLGCVVLLANGAVDGQLGADDVLLAIGAAVGGAALAGTTWSGVRAAFPFQLLAAVALGVAAALLTEDTVRIAGVAAAVVWLAALNIPSTRRWFVGRWSASA